MNENTDPDRGDTTSPIRGDTTSPDRGDTMSPDRGDTMSTAQKTDIIDVLTSQHNEAKAGLASLVAADAKVRGAEFEKLAKVLAAHEHGEEAHVYPALETMGDKASQIIEERRAEEAEASDKIAQIKSLAPLSTEFATGIAQLKKAVEAHAAKEEAAVFPLLSSLDEATRSKLGDSMINAMARIAS
jgi:hemerythrin superfamily protein